jgi:ribosome biogenesis GTPase / thiamine phosphate phosphatase
VPELETLGWDSSWDAAFEPYSALGLVPGRVAAPHRGGAYDVLTAAGEVRVRLPGRARREFSPSELPVVGDWVALESLTEGTPTVEAVLPRRTKISRRAAHDPGADVAREQVVAANVDIVFVTASLADDLDPRLLERYLTFAWESGARPVILLMKADLEPDPERMEREITDIGGDVPVVAVSTRAGLGLVRVRSFLEPAATGALVGPSGVGKSTLVNTLANEDLLATGSMASDGTGRHTTTRRQLVVLPGGGILVDNPGIRELHLWLADEGLEVAFADVVELAAKCRFSDCRHETEPGCAIQAALADGTLSSERWASYCELQRELAELEQRLEQRRRSGARRRRPGTGAP